MTQEAPSTDAVDDLRAHLAELADVEDIIEIEGAPDEPGQFKIGSKSAAVWAMRKLARVREKQAENRAIAKAERERFVDPIDAWLEAANGSLEHEAERFEFLLRAWQAELIETEIGVHPLHGPIDRKVWEKCRVKMTKLPNGKIQARVSNGRFEAADAERAVKFLLSLGREDLLNIEPKVGAQTLDAALDAEDPVLDVVKRGEIGRYFVRLAVQPLGNDEAERLHEQVKAGVLAPALIVAFSLDELKPFCERPGMHEFDLRVTQQLGESAQAELWVQIPGIRKIGVDTVSITVS